MSLLAGLVKSISYDLYKNLMIFRFQKSGEYCDLKLVCKGGDINVHKVIAFSQCPVLREEIGV